jgi:hypothetical protein
MTSARTLALAAALVMACSKTEPAGQTLPPSAGSVARPDPGVSAAPVPQASASSVALAAVADAGSEAAAPTIDARCTGSAIDLTRILLEGGCRIGGREGSPLPAGSLRVTVSAPARLAPGAEGIARVTLTNTTSTDLDLRIAHRALNGPGSLGLPGSAPEAPSPVTVRQSTTSADGKQRFDATWAMLGLLDPFVRVRLAPGGSADLRVTLRARGFLPGKNYEPSRFSIDDPPDPLPPGRYRVTLHLGVEAEDAGSEVVDLEVRR